MSSLRSRLGLRLFSLKSMAFLLVIALAGCSTSRKTINPQRVESEDLVVGEGVEAKRGMDVTVHYRGMLANGDVFNTSYETNGPYRFKLGAYRVISGWDEGIVGMKEGGKRRLLIPHWHAYGRSGRGCDAEGENCVVPPLTPVIYEIELVEVHDDSAF